jgi:aryl-alcohol dehydrogenase-like predicted oxidoreductase
MIPTRSIAGFQVPAIGLGCMNLSHAYGPPPAADVGERLLLTALDLGVTLFDTAALYGFGQNETLVGRVLKPHRQRIVLCSKGGMTGQAVGPGGALQRVIDGRPESLLRDCDDSLRRLQTDVIDLYYLHRWDKRVPIEDSVGALSRLVDAGKVRTIGLSEVSAATLKRAHAVHPIAALQTEYSPWTRNPEIAVLQACRDIGATFVAFSPVARGFLTDVLPDPAALAPNDIRRGMPRFLPPNWDSNVALHGQAQALAREAGCTLAQLSLAWLLAQGSHVLPIPGTSQLQHLRDNHAAAGLALPPAVLQALSALVSSQTVAGNRYGDQARGEVDTESMD